MAKNKTSVINPNKKNKNSLLLLTADEAKRQQDAAHRRVLHAEVSTMVAGMRIAAVHADPRQKRNRDRASQKRNAIKSGW